MQCGQTLIWVSEGSMNFFMVFPFEFVVFSTRYRLGFFHVKLPGSPYVAVGGV